MSTLLALAQQCVLEELRDEQVTIVWRGTGGRGLISFTHSLIPSRILGCRHGAACVKGLS